MSSLHLSIPSIPVATVCTSHARSGKRSRSWMLLTRETPTLRQKCTCPVYSFQRSMHYVLYSVFPVYSFRVHP